MGQWMGVTGFMQHNEYIELNCAMNHAGHLDLKALRGAGSKGSIPCGVLISSMNKKTLALKVQM